MNFTWDEVKNTKNFKKHQVWFEEAMTVFNDRNALELFDEVHSTLNEDRYILLGLSSGLRFLVVVYSETKSSQIRIISARKAVKFEVMVYEKKI